MYVHHIFEDLQRFQKSIADIPQTLHKIVIEFNDLQQPMQLFIENLQNELAQPIWETVKLHPDYRGGLFHDIVRTKRDLQTNVDFVQNRLEIFERQVWRCCRVGPQEQDQLITYLYHLQDTAMNLRIKIRTFCEHYMNMYTLEDTKEHLLPLLPPEVYLMVHDILEDVQQFKKTIADISQPTGDDKVVIDLHKIMERFIQKLQKEISQATWEKQQINEGESGCCRQFCVKTKKDLQSNVDYVCKRLVLYDQKMLCFQMSIPEHEKDLRFHVCVLRQDVVLLRVHIEQFCKGRMHLLPNDAGDQADGAGGAYELQSMISKLHNRVLALEAHLFGA